MWRRPLMRNSAVFRTIELANARHLKTIMSPKQMIAREIIVATAVRCRGRMDSRG
jgi:hypothetical protein